MPKSISSQKTTTFSNNRKTIGVLVGSQSSQFQEGIVRGAHTMCEKLGYNVITFAGGPINPPGTSPQKRSRLFELVDPDMFDGIIIPLSSLTRFVTPEDAQTFLEPFNHLPIVNVSGNFDNMINITTDYSSGLHALIHHYVKDHGYKKIALFRGPYNHVTSNNRHAIYKKELEAQGLPYDENLVIYGDLDASTSNDFITELLDRRGLTCDAIVTLNDSTAIEVINLLKSRGINVPKDIAVSGSMNISDGEFSEPQLTTINEPLDELGKKAVLVLKDLFNGVNVSKNHLIPTTLITRESCGCPKKEIELTPLVLPKQTSATEEDKLHGVIASLKDYCTSNNLDQRLLSKDGLIWDILDAYKDAYTDNHPEVFSAQLELYINKSLSDQNITIWIDFLTNMLDHTTQYSFEETPGKITLQILNTLNQLLEYLHSKNLIYQRQETKFYIEYLRNVSHKLSPSIDLVAIHKYVIQLLSLKNCFIVVYEDATSTAKKATCLHALRDEQLIALMPNQKIFDEQLLVPSSIKPFSDRYDFILLPLYYKNDPLGYMFIDYKERNRTAHENIQSLISAALKNQLQHDELKTAEERFRDIAHSTSDWLWETNAEGLFTYSSSSVNTVLGLTSNQVIGLSMADVLHLDTSDITSKIKRKEPLVNLNCSANHVNGAVRYLLISGIPHDRDNRFIGYRGVVKNITDQTLQEERIKHLAYYDILTGLPNRTLFQDQLEHLLKESHTTNSPLATIFFDIDRFKYINDSMGHTAGDIILQKVSNLLRESIDSKYVLARIGGDEFTIIVNNVVSRSQVSSIIDTIICNLQPAMKLEGQNLYVTMSFGIAMYPHDGTNADTLLKNADSAMYKAKMQGRNNYIFYDQILDDNNMTQLQQEDLLHDAIKNNHFFIEYQPHVLTPTGEIRGFEALVRIKHPTLGTIYPNDFIPLAEELGLIGKIDEWVLNEVCQCINRWQQMGLSIVPISVNMSATQLENDDLVAIYQNILKQHHVNPNFIQLEITENALIENEATALTILTQLKEHGFFIALDDFGTGHSSLTCVNLFPIDIIKIDRSFIIDSVSHKKSRAIITTIMHMARELDLKVIAEGVEIEEQYKLIHDLECDLIQGYYFSKPKSMDNFEEMLISKSAFPIARQ